MGGIAGIGGAAGSSGATSCPPGSHNEGGRCTSSVSEWKTAPALQAARDHHMTYIVETSQGPFIYASGGIQNMKVPLSSTEMSAISKDGSLATWSSTAKLDEAVVWCWRRCC